MASDAFVVVDEVTAAVQDELPSIDFDPLDVVRRVAVNDVDPCLIDQPVCELSVSGGYAIAPVAAPVNRRDDDVMRLAQGFHSRRAVPHVSSVSAQKVDPRLVVRCRPRRRDSAIGRTEAEALRTSSAWTAGACHSERRSRPVAMGLQACHTLRMTKKADRINARLGEDLSRKVEYIAERTGQGTSDIVRESIAVYFKTLQESPNQAAKALAGFVGCVDGPRDLSSRYKERLTRSMADKV